jgi:putative transposase
MPRPYSLDLRERVVAAVKEEGLSRHLAAARFGVAVSTAINWVKRYDTQGNVEPSQIGGHKPRKISGAHADWLRARCLDQPFTLLGLVRELSEDRSLKVDYRSVWEFIHREQLSFKKNADCHGTRPPRCCPPSDPMGEISGADQS